MPNIARWAATLTLTATAVCGPLSGAALAAPASLHAPSALVLTLGHGEDAALAAPQRAVTLSCAPTASGSHPDAVAACAALKAAGGDLDALPAEGGALCTGSTTRWSSPCRVSGRADASTISAPSPTSA